MFGKLEIQLMSKQEKLSLTARIFWAMVSGALLGFALQYGIGPQDFVIGAGSDGTGGLGVRETFIEFFKIIGAIFIASLKMLVVPLVLVSLICGTCSLGDLSKLGRLGGKAIALYLLTTCIAISVAMTFAIYLEPGVGLDQLSESTFQAKESPSFADTVINMFPSNPISAMAEGNMIQVIVFAILFGIAMVASGEPGKRLLSLFQDLNDVILRLILLLMNLAPYGVFCLIAKLTTEIDISSLVNLALYFAVVLAALFFHAFVNFTILLKLFTGLNVTPFYTKMRDAALFAFSTSSSNATMPITMETATKKLGVNNNIASFTVPLGATINMDGTAIMQGVATVFIAQAFNVDLTLMNYITVIVTATLASIGTAGVPGVGIIMLAMVLEQVGLPLEGIAIVLGVDRLLDMTRTAVNVTGDCMVSIIVAKSEGEFNQRTFEDHRAGKELENTEFDLKQN